MVAGTLFEKIEELEAKLVAAEEEIERLNKLHEFQETAIARQKRREEEFQREINMLRELVEASVHLEVIEQAARANMDTGDAYAKFIRDHQGREASIPEHAEGMELWMAAAGTNEALRTALVSGK